MKKLLLQISPIALVVFLTINAQQAKAQGQMKVPFKCHNFYGNGVTEYLERVYLTGDGAKDEFYYYTSANRKKIKLITVSFKKQKIGGKSYMIHTVRFPGDTKKYRLTSNFNSNVMHCDNPNGKRQTYKTGY